jgi:hypothetical protein
MSYYYKKQEEQKVRPAPSALPDSVHSRHKQPLPHICRSSRRTRMTTTPLCMGQPQCVEGSLLWNEPDQGAKIITHHRLDSLCRAPLHNVYRQLGIISTSMYIL